MMADLDGIVGEGVDRRHAVAGLLAAVLSVAFHLSALFWLSDVRFEVAVVPDERQDREWVVPTRVIDVKRESGAEGTRPGETREGTIRFLEDLAARAEALGLPADEVIMEPPPLEADSMQGEAGTVVEPRARKRRRTWHVRQEVLAIQRQQAVETIASLGRKRIPPVVRVNSAPDVSVPVDRTSVKPVAGPPAAEETEAAGPVPMDLTQKAAGSAGGDTPSVSIGEQLAESGGDLFREEPGDVVDLKPIENLLVAEVSTYSPLLDLRYGYFRVEIKRAGPDVLPVMPKDVLLVQDCSASMAEQRLYFCRDGLHRSLEALNPEDRFNVVAFREDAERCFPDWASAGDEQALEKARGFVRELRSGGNTDIYGSLQDLTEVTGDAARPMLGIVITDGHSTTGMTDNSEIIGEFTKANDGEMSVFAMGTIQSANRYLLDLLSYCNRGNAILARGGRWGIPESMVELVNSVSRPVLTDIAFRFAGGECEVYPSLSADLYMDRPLVFYGRYPKRDDRIVFQVVGQGLQRRCDMIFNLPVTDETKTRDKSIRMDWARQKIYHLIGEFTRTRNPDVLETLRGTSRDYRVPIPHWGAF